ncbi:alpha/beta hydrolase [Streptomyces rectiverticillatus]|uniref:alpha/beta hydrolase family protein n=1 Tax=Streptomyces rectiverticillatus TaxID=173860 RepID=UPI0015C3DA5F|nr:alpha/beta fold hydrolase [Streptomyces rectiverticillatus]QLE73126.1 alpha/beta hydrolase [Streptomyces rectiverticillatus]
MTVETGVTRTLARTATGKAVDVYARPGAGSAPAVLLWHGMGPDEREIVRPVAEAAAAQGVVVFAADWRSDAPDRGMAHLLDSLSFVRERAAESGGDPGRVVVAGWSAGAGAAVATALRAELFGGWRPAAVVGLAGRYDVPARTTASVPLKDLADLPDLPDLPAGAAPVPVRLVHGTVDDQVDIRFSRECAAALQGHGWPVRLDEPRTDHAGVLGSEFDPALGRLRPSTAEHALEGCRITARALVEAAGITA